MGLMQYYRTTALAYGPLEPETIATVALMSVQPSSSRIKEYDRLIKGVKAALDLPKGVNNLNTKLEVLCIRAAHDAQAGILNWVKDSIHSNTVNSPLFHGNKGFSTAGGANYINTNFNQITGHTNWGRDDNCVCLGFMDVDFTLPVSRRFFGARAGSRYDLLEANNPSMQFQFNNNQAGAASNSEAFTVENGLSFFAMQRSNPLEYSWRVSNLTGIVNFASTGITNQPFYELTWAGSGGTPDPNYCTPEVKTTFLMLGKSGVDLLAVYTALQNYINRLHR